jgi:hypothetical protein
VIKKPVVLEKAEGTAPDLLAIDQVQSLSTLYIDATQH